MRHEIALKRRDISKASGLRLPPNCRNHFGVNVQRRGNARYTARGRDGEGSIAAAELDNVALEHIVSQQSCNGGIGLEKSSPILFEGMPLSRPFIKPCSSENENLVGGDRLRSKSVHRASLGALDHLFGGQFARVHAGSAEQHLSAGRNDTFEHFFDIVLSVWRFLAGPRRKNGVGEQKYCDAALGIELVDRMREMQRIIGAFRAVGRIVEDEETIHRVGPFP